jgi:hypothetical protein
VGEWERLLRERESVVEAAAIMLWRYVLRTPIYWYTYPFRLFIAHTWMPEWEKYKNAKRRERSTLQKAGDWWDNLIREDWESDPAPVDLERVVFVDQSTEAPDTWSETGKRLFYPKPRVRVRRYNPVAPGSSFQYVRYTHEDGRVEWGIQHTGDIKVGYKEGNGAG